VSNTKLFGGVCDSLIVFIVEASWEEIGMALAGVKKSSSR
jgi:hypothetical protein